MESEDRSNRISGSTPDGAPDEGISANRTNGMSKEMTVTIQRNHREGKSKGSSVGIARVKLERTSDGITEE